MHPKIIERDKGDDAEEKTDAPEKKKKSKKKGGDEKDPELIKM